MRFRLVVALSCVALALAACASQPAAESSSSSVGASSGSELNKPPADVEATAKSAVGMSEAQGTKMLNDAGLSTRVVYRDGEDLPATKDYSPTRVNLWIEDGTIIKVSIG